MLRETVALDSLPGRLLPGPAGTDLPAVEMPQVCATDSGGTARRYPRRSPD
jgi:hypothetical protein